VYEIPSLWITHNVGFEAYEVSICCFPRIFPIFLYIHILFSVNVEYIVVMQVVSIVNELLLYSNLKLEKNSIIHTL